MDMREFAEALGLTEKELSKFANVVSTVDVSPKAELMHRLNLRVQDIDPGPSINWPGDRAILELWDHRV